MAITLHLGPLILLSWPFLLSFFFLGWIRWNVAGDLQCLPHVGCNQWIWNSLGCSSSKGAALFLIHCLAYHKDPHIKKIKAMSDRLRQSCSKIKQPRWNRTSKWDVASVWCCWGLFRAPFTHTDQGSCFFLTGPAVWSVGVGCQPLCIWESLGNGSWMGAGGQCVCVHTAVFQPRADQPSPLIREFNAIMPVGAASVSLWHLLCCSHCSFDS